MEIEYFISGEFEKRINKKMLYYDYVFPIGEVDEYIHNVCEIPVDTLLKYVFSLPAPDIGAKDVFQFSNLEDATARFCKLLAEVDNPGLKHVGVGKLLLDDGKKRNEAAYVKYGENHAKTAVALGLAFELSKTYFLSCIGTVYADLEDEAKQRLMTRLLIRNPFVMRVLSATKNGKLPMRQFLYMLSDTTYLRRSSNIKRIMSELEKSEEFDFSIYTKNMSYMFER